MKQILVYVYGSIGIYANHLKTLPVENYYKISR
jgi:hypothetical protein